MNASKVAWDDCRMIFEEDRQSLRDIYVLNANIDDWQRTYAILKSQTVIKYSEDGKEIDPPDSVNLIFKARAAGRSTLLSMWLGTVRVNSYFWTDEEIECDISPIEVNSQAELDSLLEFMERIGDSVGKPVLLTAENVSEAVLIRYDPATSRFQKLMD